MCQRVGADVDLYGRERNRLAIFAGSRVDSRYQVQQMHNAVHSIFHVAAQVGGPVAKSGPQRIAGRLGPCAVHGHGALLHTGRCDTLGSWCNDPKGSRMKFTAGQIRAARALIGMSQGELAARAGVSVPTVKRAESDSKTTSKVADETRQSLRAVLEASGVEFTNGDMPGVRLNKVKPSKR
jgi:DNA-binding XRE family transcriptional regulator